MKLSFLSGKKNTVNLLINDYSIQFLELKSSSPLVASRFGEYLLPPGIVETGRIADTEKFEIILEERIQEWGLKRKSVRFLVPDSVVVIKRISIPADIKEDEIKGYLYLEFGTNIHLPFENPVFDYTVLNSTGGQRELLLYAAPEDLVSSYAALFEKLKLPAVSADISPLSQRRLHDHFHKLEEQKSTLMVQFQLNAFTMTIFEGIYPILTRHIPIDFLFEDWETTQSLISEGYYRFKPSHENELENSYVFQDAVKEMEKVMNFFRFSLHQGNREIDAVFICGDHPFLGGIEDIMNSRLDIPVLHIGHSEILTAQGEKLPEKFYSVLGLALKEV
ncbi:pilus assembly protein PilM [Bacillus lacus]|uniref:Pilus assembly protein PilM n=1 Tax=Metabacillus lacus TaxID=1983721 RepID=A0A7X2IX42_9BACI|nr:pilus assembly protein PilM [Metabacillus lacus]MRX71432.1 pilus assembly protein PilM [Metabacillus lacus]